MQKVLNCNFTTAKYKTILMLVERKQFQTLPFLMLFNDSLFPYEFYQTDSMKLLFF